MKNPAEENVQQLLYEVLSNDVDVVAFTSNTQVKFFFEGARRQRAEGFVQRAFNERVIALSVGSMTSAALREYGITRIVAPEHERMGAMVMELVTHYKQSFPTLINTREERGDKERGRQGDKEIPPFSLSPFLPFFSSSFPYRSNQAQRAFVV